MSCLNNTHYKSTAMFYNTVAQTVEPKNVATNPVIVQLLGNEATNTGCSITVNTSNVTINSSGTYDIDVTLIANASTAGDITCALRLNGNVIPETVKTYTVGTTSTVEISLDTIEYFRKCCCNTDVIDCIAYSDGTLDATVKIAGSIVKLA